MDPKVRNKKYWRKPKLLPLSIAAITFYEVEGMNDDGNYGNS